MIKINFIITSRTGPPKLPFFEKLEIEISSIDICGNYKPISTTFSENFHQSGEYYAAKKCLNILHLLVAFQPLLFNIGGISGNFKWILPNIQ